eukprot:15130455-Alexandrium_andersonii.AAC.1
MDGCPAGGLAARSEDATAMGRVAFPVPPEAARAFSDLLAWRRAAQEAAEALGRQGRASPERGWHLWRRASRWLPQRPTPALPLLAGALARP